MEANAPRYAPLGHALHERVEEISHTILSMWQERCPRSAASADRRVKEDILRTTRRATTAVTSYFMQGANQTPEQKRAEAAAGKAPLRETISLTDLTKLYLYWRDATIGALREEALRLGLDRSTTDDAVDIVRGGSDGSIVRMVKEFDTERQRLQEELRREQARLAHEALHDSLTGLPNRKLFFDRLRHALAASARRTFATAVLFIDIDQFKAVNDDYGHTVGDQLLVAVADRLRDRVRTNDTVARLGGDEFVILCEDLVSPPDEAQALLERVETAFAKPFVIAEHSVPITASIGLAIATADCDPDVILTRADHAMYRAKQYTQNAHTGTTLS
jgi:diguanylate cyclase (GGDEF)-like protein